MEMKEGEHAYSSCYLIVVRRSINISYMNSGVLKIHKKQEFVNKWFFILSV